MIVKLKPVDYHDCPFFVEQQKIKYVEQREYAGHYRKEIENESWCNWKKKTRRPFAECTGIRGPGCPFREDKSLSIYVDQEKERQTFMAWWGGLLT